MHSREVKCKAVIHYKYFLPSIREVAKFYNVSKSSLQTWIKDDLLWKHRKPRNKKCIETSVKQSIQFEIKTNPYITIKRLTSKLNETIELNKSSKTINKYVRNIGFTQK